MRKKRILLVEDHPVFRLGMSEMINQEEDLVICGWAESVAEAWNEISRLEPDIVVADISLKNSDGLELVRDMKRLQGHIPVLVLSMHHEALYAERAVMAGARGYIMKQEAPASVVTAVRTVLEGRIYLSDDMKEKLLQGIAGSPGPLESPMDRLAPRELEVFTMLGQGLTTREIAGRMNLSVKTIGTYRERLKEKLNLRHGNELLKYAMSWSRP
jgi:DNA-binding NarL/FixJ family response regulator